MNTEQERAQFEAWYRLHHGSLDVYGRDASGEYADKQVQGAFNVWQARAAMIDLADDIRAALAAQPAVNGYTCTVPDDCETLHWRGQILSMNELASMAQTKRSPYNASGSLSEYGVFPECDAQQPADDEVVFIDGVGAARSSIKSCRDGVQWIRVGDRVYWPLSDSDAKRLHSACCGNGSFDGPSAPVGMEAIREAFDEISGLCRHLRQGGPAPEDLQDLSDALDEAVGIAANMLHALPQQPAAVDEAVVEAVARAICVACEENPDHEGDARGNDFRWQDYRDAALAAISALATHQQGGAQ